MNRFLNEDNGLQMAFLDGNQPDRVCAPMQEYIESKGGAVHMNAPLKEIVTNADGSVKHLIMRDGSTARSLFYFPPLKPNLATPRFFFLVFSSSGFYAFLCSFVILRTSSSAFPIPALPFFCIHVSIYFCLFSY